MPDRLLHIAMVWEDGAPIEGDDMAVVQTKLEQLRSTVELIVRVPVKADAELKVRADD